MTKQENKDSQSLAELERGFINRYFAQISLPHSKLDASTFTRKTGNFTLDIISDPKIGLPYGTYPRLLLAWICSEATKTQKTELHLGSNQSEFMRKLDISRQGSTIAMLKDQTTRLVNTLFRVTVEGDSSRARRNILIADSSFEFWETHNGGWETHLNLNKKFLEDLLAHPVPLDLNVLNEIRKSPLAMDVYTWVAYRTYGVYTSGGRPIKIPWESLQAQFAANYGKGLDTNTLTADELIKKETQALIDFRRKFLISLKKLATYYPVLNDVIHSDSQFLTIGGAKLIPYK
ncbi:MAG: protein kinase [Crenarchaeota archaeon]|jgi:hypothetical protein|nr:protein kinase [Thermoproteota archaeon]